jgi:hypothetical protein
MWRQMRDETNNHFERFSPSKFKVVTKIIYNLSINNKILQNFMW